MKVALVAVLVGLLFWNGLLTWTLYVGFGVVEKQEFEIGSLARDLNKARVRLSKDESVLIVLNKEEGKIGTREHELELILTKLITILSEPVPDQPVKPSSLADNSQWKYE